MNTFCQITPCDCAINSILFSLVIKMKIGISVFLVFVFGNEALSQLQARDTLNVASFQFSSQHIHFGSIPQGHRKSQVYTFKNVGKVPLRIENVLVNCGCTVPFWPKKPVAVGEKDSIRVFFNSAGKIGLQQKNITILANTKSGKEVISFSAQILPTQ